MKTLKLIKNIVVTMNFVVAVIYAALAIIGNLVGVLLPIFSVLLIVFATATMALSIYVALANNKKTKKWYKSQRLK